MARHPGFDWLVRELAPGGGVRSVRRLKGGLGAHMHAVQLERADGTRVTVTLRRGVREWRDGAVDHIRGEYARLQLVEKAGIPAPRPLLIDTEGTYFGVPALVLTYIPGASRYQANDPAGWTRGLARAAQQIHAVTPDRYDLSALRSLGREQVREELNGLEEEIAASPDPLVRDVYSVLLANIDRVEWPAPTLIHEDFWPGNTVWYRGRLAAIIDWGDANLGDPRTDVAQMQMEIAFTIGIEPPTTSSPPTTH